MSQTLSVHGMSCADCEATVTDALEGVDGVRDASADRESETATVEGDADTLDLIAAVEDAGYEADSA
ncbi:heavy-metal-associated domain-containing protein [Candidatus Halobonum tyrrellensis]|uniref:Heavy metal transport/detoxification protein n=1 Tax=Candidatus Halobonum tyrrellensis G22 TaxID=1324957 RepID=V4GTT4_9EURY|nr:heavy metal-associated domain-containing protein [Candidatus Halobonum tyrrellensis]ESP88531.1 Heavy metal transport/detoxification protein [Candidatus Halobonum tyrrellensis G22]